MEAEHHDDELLSIIVRCLHSIEPQQYINIDRLLLLLPLLPLLLLIMDIDCSRW